MFLSNIMQLYFLTLTSNNITNKMNKNIFFSVDRVLQRDNGFKVLILLNKVLFQSCYNLFHSVTIVNSLRERTFLPFLKGCISKKFFWDNPNNLMFPLFLSGDIIISINLFVPIKDGSKDITQDNIHHHGWRLLTTGVISGDGYETITFERQSHLNKNKDHICLKIKEDYKHIPGESKFIDSQTPHVVFHPKTPKLA